MSLFILCPKQSPKPKIQIFSTTAFFPHKFWLFCMEFLSRPPLGGIRRWKTFATYIHQTWFSRNLCVRRLRVGAPQKKNRDLLQGQDFVRSKSSKKNIGWKKKNFLLIPAKTFGEGFLSRAPASSYAGHWQARKTKSAKPSDLGCFWPWRKAKWAVFGRNGADGIRDGTIPPYVPVGAKIMADDWLPRCLASLRRFSALPLRPGLRGSRVTSRQIQINAAIPAYRDLLS